MQLSTAVRNARLDVIESTMGTDAVLKIFTGTPPADCSVADSGDLLSAITLPTDWLNAASAGAKTKKGTWSELSADGTGTAGYFRVYASDATTCHVQGTVTATGGGGDLTLNTIHVVLAQVITVTAFSITDGNA